jgi:hypothetical protein
VWSLTLQDTITSVQPRSKGKHGTEAAIHENEGLEGGDPYSTLIPTKNMIIINENAYL